jgi:hypothetical protein
MQGNNASAAALEVWTDRNLYHDDYGQSSQIQAAAFTMLSRITR